VGNFPFEDSSRDGADLRFVSGDDKTPLNHHFELFDGTEQLAVAWVQLPAAAGAARSIWLYYGNRRAPAVANAHATYEAADSAVFHLAEKDGVPLDATSFAVRPARFTGSLGAGGVVDGGARLAANEALVLPAAPPLDVAPGRGFTFSGWFKPDGAEATGLLFSRANDKAALAVGLERGRPYVEVATDAKNRTRGAAPDALAAGAWHHVALAWSDRLVLYVDGKAAVTLPVPAVALGGDPVIGAHPVLGPGLAGDVDELQFASVARPASWVAATAAAQDATAEAVKLAQEEESGGGEYYAVLRTLAGAVSTDGWVVIGLIAILGFVCAQIMISKLLLLRRIESANAAFLERFRALGADPTALGAAAPGAADELQRLGASALFAVYRGGVEEYRRQRDSVAAAGGAALAAANLEVIKANIDTTIVHESNRMTRRMVVLTLAVSAAPFLGLLGTVVGIMITFGAIALAGDVNVNTIAPGVSAALAATVSGLAVAIPVMFGYNFLATKIRELTTAMEVFANELVGRLAVLRVAG
jgi:biopolymer transport protein ExbB